MIRPLMYTSVWRSYAPTHGRAARAHAGTGSIRFELTRGDSVSISPELQQAGVSPSPVRWWIRRIVEQRVPTGGFAPNPARATLLSDALRLYWNPG